jgi:nitrous-oxide reductase
MKKFLLLVLALGVGAAVAIGACGRRPIRAGQGDLLQLAQARGLTPEDAARALKTFVPPGGRDEYMLFASGGHSGQVHVIGVPSMRLLKTIAVFTPEPWQGYGYGADWSEAALNGESNPDPGEHLRWGDSHHPALSETDGKYDGRWLYINDRAHGRIGMVDLGDFRTKQVLHVPNLQTSHGGIFATPDTRYVHISSKVPALKAWNAAKGQRVTVDDHLNRYADIYRGYSTFIRVDRAAAVHPGSRRRRQGRELRVRVHQLLQRRDGDRRHGARKAAARGRRVGARFRLPAHHQLEESGRRGRGRKVHGD